MPTTARTVRENPDRKEVTAHTRPDPPINFSAHFHQKMGQEVQISSPAARSYASGRGCRPCRRLPATGVKC